MTSKIPPTEWDAIVARRDKGESVSYIARTYDTSPATIYAILKKAAESAEGAGSPPVAEASVPPPTPAVTPTRLTLSVTRPAEPRAQITLPTAPAPAPVEVPPPTPVIATPAAPVVSAPTVPPAPFKFTYENRAVDPPVRQPRPPTVPRPFPEPEPKTALSANLDQELRARADEAIGVFQQAFSAVLVEETVATRKALRQAASDLMRVAARTTIALERKDALVDRAAMPPMQRPRNEPSLEPGDFRQGRRQPRN